jgi:ABC-2 type transport system permease protein
MASPIADLSYRSYEGPLEAPRYRWWAIARMGIGRAFRNRVYWVLTSLSAWYFIGISFVLFLFDRINEQSGGASPAAEFMSRIVWKDQFLIASNFGQLFFLFIGLLLGAGMIANDNRANALLVYLSKPCTQKDYIVGKWLGLFIPLLVAMAGPALLFFLYGALSYRAYGFLSSDPWLPVRLLLFYPVSAAFIASLITGVSSLFNQGRIAGATYAGIYLFTNFFTILMLISYSEASRGRSMAGTLTVLERLYYFSIDGLVMGWGKAILNTDGSPFFGLPSRSPMVPAPGMTWVLAAIIILSSIAILIAWRRVRAVEVVQ